MQKLLPDVRKGPANFLWFTTPTSAIEMRCSESTPRLLQIVGDSSAEWLTEFETPASIKTDPISNNYLKQTMETMLAQA